MSGPQMAMLAVLAWLGADVAIVGGWLATVGLVRRRSLRRTLLDLGLSTGASPVAVLPLRRRAAAGPSRAGSRAPHSGTRRRGRAS